MIPLLYLLGVAVEKSRKPKGRVRKVVRDAGSGQFVRPEEAQLRPETTVVEKISVKTRLRGWAKRLFGR
jgi:hypothetical protein